MVDELTGRPMWSELSDHDRRLELGLHAGGRIAFVSYSVNSTSHLVDRYGSDGLDMLDDMFARTADAIDGLCDQLFRMRPLAYTWVALTRTADDELGTAYAGELIDRLERVAGLLRAEPELWRWTGESTYLRPSDTIADVALRTSYHGPDRVVWSGGWKQLRP